MYAIIWLSFFEILLGLFSPFADYVTVAVHAPLGLAVLALAFYISGRVSASSCPERVKRITKATRDFAIFQVLVGLTFAVALFEKLPSIYLYVIGLIHVATALTIISQASSSATGYDMWEEKEFQPGPAMAPSTA
jgi:hypothetical protein